MYDFETYWLAAVAVISGHSPYTVAGFLSPYPLAWFFVPFGFVPVKVSSLIWGMVNAAATVVLVKKSFPRALLYLPVFFAILVRQIDLPVLAVGLCGGWFGLALTTLKPQLAIWIIPWVVLNTSPNKRRRLVSFAGVSALLLYAVPTLYYPQWISEYLAVRPSLVHYASGSTSLFGLMNLLPFNKPFMFVCIVIAGVMTWLCLKPMKNYWSFAALFNPVSNIYSLSVLVRDIDWIAVLLSWAMLPLVLWVHSGFPMITIPLYLWLRNSRTKNPPKITEDVFLKP